MYVSFAINAFPKNHSEMLILMLNTSPSITNAPFVTWSLPTLTSLKATKTYLTKKKLLVQFAESDIQDKKILGDTCDTFMKMQTDQSAQLVVKRSLTRKTSTDI
jgi:hypothetical protein